MSADRIDSMMGHPCVAHLGYDDRAATVAAAVSKEFMAAGMAIIDDFVAPNWLDNVETLEPTAISWVRRSDSPIEDPVIHISAGIMSIVEAVSTTIGGDISSHLMLDVSGASAQDLLATMRVAASVITSSKPGAHAAFYPGTGSHLVVEARW